MKLTEATRHARNARIAEHRRCVEFLHLRAKLMSDPKARDILNSAANCLGSQGPRALSPEAPASLPEE